MVRLVVAASAWTLAGSLAVARTMSGESALTAWEILAVGLAAIPTMWFLMSSIATRALGDMAGQHERVVNEVAAELADSLTENGVTRLR